MRDEVVDLAIRAVEALPYESGRRLRDDVGGLLPAVSDKAWSLLPLLDRVKLVEIDQRWDVLVDEFIQLDLPALEGDGFSGALVSTWAHQHRKEAP